MEGKIRICKKELKALEFTIQSLKKRNTDLKDNLVVRVTI